MVRVYVLYPLPSTPVIYVDITLPQHVPACSCMVVQLHPSRLDYLEQIIITPIILGTEQPQPCLYGSCPAWRAKTPCNWNGIATTQARLHTNNSQTRHQSLPSHRSPNNHQPTKEHHDPAPHLQCTSSAKSATQRRSSTSTPSRPDRPSWS
jgi:hypothetical protein